VLGKIAFWSFLVLSIISTAGDIALGIGTHSISTDLLIWTITMWVAVVLLATRLRWAPVVTTLIGVYGLIVAFTEPFAYESLANPKGPNGGIYHFIGNVVGCGLSMLAFGGSLTEAVRIFRGGSGTAPRWLGTALGVVVGMVIGATFIGAISQPAAPAATTYTNGVPTVHLSAGSFDQSSVTISTGSKLLLVDDTSSVHVIDNGSWQNNRANTTREPGAPLVSNVHLSGDSATIGPFATAGTYSIYCIVHPGMELTIIVQ
jgi:plastocyanin